MTVYQFNYEFIYFYFFCYRYSRLTVLFLNKLQMWSKWILIGLDSFVNIVYEIWIREMSVNPVLIISHSL